MSEAGKGSGRRPAAISDAQYQERWDAIFCKDLCTSEECAKEDLEFNAIEETNVQVNNGR